MERQVLVTEANPMTNHPKIISGSRKPLKWGFLYRNLVCQNCVRVKLGLAGGFTRLELINPLKTLAEGVGFEPTLGLLLSLISSQVPSTTQPPFRSY